MIGQMVSHYIIIEKLGEGGMGVVYKAQDTRLDRLVALKFLPPNLAAGKEEKQRFLTEAKAASALDHPNICTVYDINETDEGQMYIALAYYDGATLKTKLGEGELSTQDFISIVLQLAQALSKAHARGIIHRDIKPANVIITSEGVAKLIDFGLATLATSSHVSATQTTPGTLAYMSPEQLRGKRVDHRTDIWSFGIMMYEMLTGATPYFCDIDLALVYSVLNETPVPLRDKRPDLAPLLEQIVNKCLEKRPEHRYQTIDELIDEVQLLLQPPRTSLSNEGLVPFNATAVDAPGRRYRRLRWAGLLAAACLLAMSFFLRWPLREDQPKILSDNVIALFPFRLYGPADLSYLEEGMQELLHINLHDAGQLRTVDPKALFNQVNRLGKKLGIEDARHIARFFGAGRFMIGTLVAEREQLRISAALYQTDSKAALSIPVIAEGKADSLFKLVDAMTSEIIGSFSSGPADRYERVSAATTLSLPALKEYLLARHAEREGRIEEAYEHYQKATELDTCFAMAWLGMGAMDVGWLFNQKRAEYELNKALRYSTRLKKHDQLLLEAWQRTMEGHNESVLDIGRKIVESSPDDIRGWDLLANMWWQTSALFGRPITENQAAVNRLLELDPQNAANYHGALFPALCRGDLAEIDTLLARLHRVAPDMPFTWSVELPRAFLTDDTLMRRRLIAQADKQSELCEMIGFANAAASALDVTEIYPYIRRMLAPTRSKWMRANGYLTLTWVEMGRGRWLATMHNIDSLGTILPEYTNAIRGLYYPFYAYFSAEKTVREQITAAENWQPDTTIRPFGTEWDFVPLRNILPYIKWYHLGMLSHFSGDAIQAELYASRLAQASPAKESKSLLRIWAATIRSLEARQRQNPARALQILENEPTVIRFPLYSSPGYSIAFTRFLRAELLALNGRSEEALSWFRAFKGIYVYDIPFRAPAALRMAEIYEKSGRRREAIAEYRKFLYLWRDCDKMFAPIVTEAQKHLAALERI